MIQRYKEKFLLYTKDSKNYPDIFFVASVITYILLMSVLVLKRYDSLNNWAFDFGTHNQAIWSTANGDFMWQTIGIESFGSRLGFHFEPLMIMLLSPLYLIFQDGRFLLVIQTIVLALGALPLYLIAKLKFESRWISLVFPLSYLLYPYLHNVNLFDFHSVMFSPLLIGSVWYAIEKENIKLFTLSVIGSIMIKENIFVIVVLLCLYAFFKTRYRRETMILAIVSTIYGLIVVNFVIPTFSGKHYLYVKENSIQNIILSPPIHEFVYITKELFGPLLFTPILNPIPYLSSTILLMWHSNRDINIFLNYHYSADVISLVFISSILGMAMIPNYVNSMNKIIIKKKISKNIINANLLQLIMIILLLMSSTYSFFASSQAINSSPITYQQSEHDRIGIDIINKIPPDAIVMAQTHLVPRLSNRKYIFLLPIITDEYDNKVEYVIFDTKPETTIGLYPFKNIEDLKTTCEKYYNRKDIYEPIIEKDGYIVFKRI